MDSSCQYCASERVFPVLFARMDNANWKAGNKYRGRCPECERWLPMCQADEWREHDRPHVLPASEDPDDPTLVPAEDTDYADDLTNRFECPKPGCTTTHTGFPDECDTCNTAYNW